MGERWEVWKGGGNNQRERGQGKGNSCSHPLTLTLLLPPSPCQMCFMLLMTDVLVFLQEKDQKYIFPALVRPSTFFLSIDKACFRPFLLSYPGQEILPTSNSYYCNHRRNIIRKNKKSQCI